MTDDLRQLRQLRDARPDPQPHTAVVDRHRQRLLAQIADGGGAGLIAPTPPGEGSPYAPIGVPERASPRSRPRRPARIALLVGAAAAAAAGIALVMTPEEDRAHQLDATGTPTGEGAAPAATETSTPPTCGSDLPTDVDVPGALAPATDGPAPGTDNAFPGQLARHWKVPTGWVEVRWPAAPVMVYGIDEPQSSWNGSSTTTEDGRYELHPAPTTPDQVMSTPVLALDPPVGAPPSEICRVMEIAVATGADRERLGLDLWATSVGGYVDLGPLITSIEDVPSAPGSVLPCQGGDVPMRGSELLPTPAARPEPALALTAFLDLPEHGALARSGYAELHEPDGSITYAKQIDGGEGYVTLIEVVPVDGGWAVERWKASGC